MGRVKNGLKVCVKCGIEKPVSEFYKRSDNGSYRSSCKSCHAKTSADYYFGNKERYRVNSKRWVSENRDRAREIGRDYARRHREARSTNRKRYYAEHRDEILVRELTSRDANRDRWRQYWREWGKRNRDKTSAANRRYRARVIGNGGSHTEEEWLSLLNACGNKCARCGTTERITRDHIVPIALGGTDNIDNIQPLCLSCNAAKGKREIVDYRNRAIAGANS